MRVPVIGREGVEADDVIASLVRRLEVEHEDLAIRIVSRDKDLSQLIDDRVELNEHVGRVEKITLRSTWVRHEFNGSLCIIPNGEITQVINLSRDWAKAVCDVGVTYGADLDKVKATINGIAVQANVFISTHVDWMPLDESLKALDP